MAKCCDCKIDLTNENRSEHQPTIRCGLCFPKFADKVSKRLEYWADGGLGLPPEETKRLEVR